MSHQCPFCELIYASRPEIETHILEDHPRPDSENVAAVPVEAVDAADDPPEPPPAKRRWWKR